MSKKSKTPIQFQQQENTPRRQHEAIIQEGTQQERARKKTRRDRKRQTEGSLKSPLTVSLSVCLARDDEEEEEEEKKNISEKKADLNGKEIVTHHHHHHLIILSPFNASVKSTIDPVYITDK